ncbi:hypothetical protein POSPLADRAFT_1141366 [Postia placenta MAD-698-R-SB12]|uniref:F-box domain-containing protein n=1 Tax=Postia placenta MAD-698-R-SB12 TaxID=670580 RepID=A0A1X6N1Q7_9APHY|nr:hypothetical protein POSPLADRAFT_1141366 [Postia placenta MAD-698-R-SB12]OSX62549.1 hypothetical protein POSPLADRAFT_1141366 [Postia placenta MAD-698-R-SB12]
MSDIPFEGLKKFAPASLPSTLLFASQPHCGALNMPLGYVSTVQRVLEIPEIVELILSFLDQKEHAASACVCKQWSEIALDHLWRDVDDLYRLFSILAPLTPTELTQSLEYHSFSRTLNADDWARFAPYGRRVRKLSYREDGPPTTPQLSSKAFDEIARSRTTLSILPNLRTLEWRSERVRLSLVCMSDTVREFTARLYSPDTHPVADFFKDFAQRMPYVTHLDLSFDFPVRDIEQNLVTLIGHLRKLQKVVLPTYCVSPKLVEGLSTLPELGVIQFEFMGQGRGDVADVQDFAPAIQEGAFPALWDLSVSARLADVTAFLRNSYAPARLTALYVHVLSVCSPPVVADFLQAVADNCKLLKSLYVELYIAPESLDWATFQTGDQLTWSDLRPVLKCPHLTTFELRWDLPLKMTHTDIEDLAASWPTLEVLMLNCDPVPLGDLAPSELTLHALLPFARHCPALRELGLLLSSSTADIAVPSLGASPFSPPPFQNLRKLCVGLSRIAEPGPAALFLSTLCPPTCELVPGVSWPEGFGVPESAALDAFQHDAAEWYERWAEVARVLPLLTRLRMEERARYAALEREVGELRARCVELEEHATTVPAYHAGEHGWCVVL